MIRLRPLASLLLLAALLAACSTPQEVFETARAGNAFAFNSAAPDEYLRVDRMGMPAIATAVITSKDAYNAADPIDDATFAFAGEIIDNLTVFHNALDDDLTGFGLVPCVVGDCVAQAAPLVIPDTLKIDITQPAGFPNGRVLADPVIDVTLAVVLLDLGAPGQSVTTLADLPLNPAANDVAFDASFPFLAAPNTP